MLSIPESLKITRSKAAENTLLRKAREWLMKEERDPRIHVSDLLDPRLAYWQRVDPRPLSDRLVTVFLVGKVLHAFVLAAVDGKNAKKTKLASDDGARYHEGLRLVYSMDACINGIPREFKTSRSFYEPTQYKDLALYCEQLLCYMVAEGKTEGQLWLLLLNLKDETGRTAPAFRVYNVRISKKDWGVFRAQMARTIYELEHALLHKDPRNLPLCREFKCGEGNCDWWHQCRPEGRYGVPKKQWPLIQVMKREKPA